MSQEVLGILGQVAPAASTEVVLYSVPQGRRAAISLMPIFNNAATDAIIQIAIVKGGSNNIIGVPSPVESKLVTNATLTAKKANTEAGAAQLKGITLDGLDDIRVMTDTLGVVFHAYGVEVLPDKT
jgi:hypothetical protein